MTEQERHMSLLHDIHSSYLDKNRDYGGSFSTSFQKFGLVSPVCRMSDKMARLETLTLVGEQNARVKDESIRDTLLDLANYAIMTVMELDKQKERETQEATVPALFIPNKYPNL